MLIIFRYSQYLQRQHRLRLRAKAAQVAKELEDDKRILEEMHKIQSAREQTDLEEKRKKMEHIQWMSQVNLKFIIEGI